jgi:hypothetical protein
LDGSSSIQTFWAFVERYEGGIYTADIDLSALAGKNVKFILSVLSAGSAAGDRALWVAPIIYNASSGAPAASATPTVTTAAPSATPTNTLDAPSETPTSTSTPTATATP